MCMIHLNLKSWKVINNLCIQCAALSPSLWQHVMAHDAKGGGSQTVGVLGMCN